MFFGVGHVGRQMIAGGGAGRPSLDLSFGGPTLDPMLTFTRGSIGTYFDSSGVMQTTQPNLWLQSADASNAAWNKAAAVVAAPVVTGNNVAAPDGTVTASRVVFPLVVGGGALSILWQAFGVVASPYTFSVWMRGNAGGEQVYLSASAVGTYYRMLATLTMAWQRYSLTTLNLTAASWGFQIGTDLRDAGESSTPAQTVYVWGAQVEQNPVASNYSPTTTVPVNNQARFDYDPVTHAALGLLIEEQRANSIRNGSAVGAVPGTPGTMPTNWSIANTSGLTFSVIGSGTESGIPYTDLRVNGTSTNNIVRYQFETATAIAATSGQAWTQSLYIRLVAGTLANVANTQMEYRVYDATQVILSPTGTSAQIITVTSAGLSASRYTLAWTVGVSSGTVAAIAPTFGINLTSTSAVVDFTIRVGGVQCEQGAFPTSYIPTTAAAVTRSADQCSIQPAQMGFYTPPGGSWAAEFINNDTTATNAIIIGRYGGTGNPVPMYVNTPAQFLTQWDGAFGTSSPTVAPVRAINRGATTFGTGVGGNVCLNAGAVVAAPGMVTGFTFPPGVGFLNPYTAGNTDNTTGYIRRVRYWPRVLSNTELQAVTALDMTPSLNLDFMSGVLDPLLTITRGSVGTYFDSGGTMQTTATNQAFPSVLATPAWTANGPTTLGGSVTLPNGTTSTTALVAATDTTNNVHGFNAAFPFASASVPLVVSAYMRAGPSNGYLQLNSGGAAGMAYFDLTNGTAVVGADLAAGLTNKSVSIVPVGNGWYRCSYSFTTTAAASGATPFVGPCTVVSTSGDNRSMVGVVGQGVYVWGIQLEYGSVATAYSPTTTAAASNGPRFDYDPITHQPNGLLIEETRTNSMTNSGPLTDFAPTLATKTAAASVAPDGTTTGVRLTEDTTATTEHFIDTSFTPAANTVYTGTLFAKANTRTFISIQFRVGGNFVGGNGLVTANLSTGVIVSATGSATASSIRAVGNGWYRISITATAVAAPSGTSPFRIGMCDNTGNNVYTGDGVSSVYVWGAQLEQGAFATSYIPTTSVAVTRNGEFCDLTPLGAWWNAATSTTQVEFLVYNYASSGGGYHRYDDLSDNNAWNFAGNTGAPAGVAMTQKSGAVVNISTAQVNFVLGSVHKVAGTMTAAGNNLAVDGVVASLGIPAVAVPIGLSRMRVGNCGTGVARVLNGYVRRVQYWPRVLNNTELQNVTT